MDITIREATPQDYEGLCQVIDTVDAMHQESLPDLFQEAAGPARSRDYILGLIADENAALFVAEADGQLVGYVKVLLADTPAVPIFVPRRYAIVDNLVVNPEFQRVGIGRALMERAGQWAVARGASAIELSVYEFNQTALAFYRSLGFDTVSRRMTKRLVSGAGSHPERAEDGG